MSGRTVSTSHDPPPPPKPERVPSRVATMGSGGIRLGLRDAWTALGSDAACIDEAMGALMPAPHPEMRRIAPRALPQPRSAHACAPPPRPPRRSGARRASGA